MHPKGADRMANSVDFDQTALIGIYTVFPDLSVQNLIFVRSVGKHWHRKRLLKAHEQIHTGDKPYSCVIFVKSF